MTKFSDELLTPILDKYTINTKINDCIETIAACNRLLMIMKFKHSQGVNNGNPQLANLTMITLTVLEGERNNQIKELEGWLKVK